MKVAAGTILTFLLGVMFVSLFNMSVGMDMTHGMTDCPFMAHEEVLCPMNLTDHIGAWQSVFQAVTPSIFILFAVVGVVLLVVSIAPNLLRTTCVLHPIPIPIQRLRERTYAFSYRPLQELFSNGILHPKLF